MSQQGFSQIIIIVAVLALLVTSYVIYWKHNDNRIPNFGFQPHQSPNFPGYTPSFKGNEKSNPLNRVYYNWKNNLKYIDIGSGETGTIDLKLELPTHYGSYEDGQDNPVHNAQLSPDKKFIIFVKDNNLWRIDIDGNNLKQLSTEGSTNNGDECPLIIDQFLISPNSQKVYYSIRSDYYSKGGTIRRYDGKVCKPTISGNLEEWVIGMDGKKQKIARDILDTSNPGKFIGWTPDSKGIYYSSHGGYTGENGGKQFEPRFVKYDFDTNTTTELLRNDIEAIDWDKDGSKGFYTSGPAYSTGSIIYLTNKNLDKLAEQPVIEGQPTGDALLKNEYQWSYWQPQQISPDGKYLVLIRTPQVHHANHSNDDWENRHLEQKSEVYLWDTETKQKTKLNGVTVDKATQISWSYDGSKLIYHVYMTQLDHTDPHQNQLYIYNIKNKKQESLLDLEQLSQKTGEFYQYFLY